MKFSHVPKALRDAPRWIAYRLVERPVKTDKIPVDHRTGKAHSAYDPEIWMSFDDALAFLAEDPGFGLGFVFSKDDGFVGIDLDHCIINGVIQEWAEKIIDCFQSYSEISVSGDGVHIYIIGKIPEGFPHSINGQGPDGLGKIETYGELRYFVVTGRRIGTIGDVECRGEELAAFCAAWMPAGPAASRGGAEALPNGLDDGDIIRMARRDWPGKGRFDPLFFDGDTAAYQGDRNRADMALVRVFAFWSGGDADAIDRLFRRSALMRDKWDSKRGDSTYGRYTITKAIETSSEFYRSAEDAPRSGHPGCLPVDPAVLHGLDRDLGALTAPELGMLKMSEVDESSITWLWKYHLERGSLALLAGNAGIGKSQILLWIATAVTTGATWPDGSGNAPIGNVVIVAAEDRPATTIKPRLMAMGADLEKITLVKARYVIKKPGRPDEVSFATLEHRSYWNNVLDRIPGVTLLIIDPIPSYLGRSVNDSKNVEIRAVLEPFLSEVIEPRGICMLGNTHLNKSADSKTPLHRISGSIAYGALPRNVHFVIKDSETPERRYLKQEKCNDAPENLPSLAFKIERRDVVSRSGEVIETAIPMFEDEPVIIDTGSMMDGIARCGKRGPDPTKTREMAVWLFDLLSNESHPMLWAAIADMAGEKGFVGDRDPATGYWTGTNALYRASDMIPKLPEPRSGKRIHASKMQREGRGRNLTYWQLVGQDAEF